MDDRQNSIERQCAMNRATDLCCAEKIELNELDDQADKILSWIQEGQLSSGSTPQDAAPAQSPGGPPASEKQKNYILAMMAKCNWDESEKNSVRAGLHSMNVGSAKSLISKLKQATGM